MESVPFAAIAGREAGARPLRHAGLTLLLALLAGVALLVVTAGQASASSAPQGALVVAPGAGPAGAHVVLAGNNLPPGDTLVVGYSSGNCSGTITTIAGASGTTDASGNVSISFVWPTTTTGNYYVCATDQTTGHRFQSSSPYKVLSASAPSITISAPIAASGSVTVTGTNFLPGGGTVEVLYGTGTTNPCATSTGTVTTNADGTFTYKFTAPFESAQTPITITAVQPQGTCGQTNPGPTLQASATGTILAAATPTATTVPSNPNPNPVGTSPSSPGFPGGGTWIACCIGALLLLLLLLLLFMVFRRRKQDEPVTIEERDRVVVNPNPAGGPGGPGGSAMIDRQIIARDARGKEVVIAEEVTTVEEEEEEIRDQFGNQPFRRSPNPGGSGPGNPNTGFNFQR
ncbi:MAG: hypothetical protein PVSMB4_03630 [Ktedonobacterales bacterium]